MMQIGPGIRFVLAASEMQMQFRLLLAVMWPLLGRVLRCLNSFNDRAAQRQVSDSG